MTPAENYAIARMELAIAWWDLEDAFVERDKEAMSAAAFAWWDARCGLRELLIEAGA